MSDLTARISLRYRPGSDVLTGQVDLGELSAAHTVTESPDADSTMMWASTLDDPGHAETYLASFHFVHASARFQLGTIPLPAELTATVQRLIDTAFESVADVDSPLAKVQAKAEASTEVSLDSLRRGKWPERPPGEQQVDRQHAVDVSSSLARLADAVNQRVPADSEREAIRTDHLSRLLRELSSTISNGRGRTAPGTTAATRAALRGGIPLTIGEQQVLDEALGELDDPVSWHRVTHSLDRLSSALERPERRE